ncbi:PhzF family phenazine biosynthesis protein [Paenibacillus hexagrammi]|uniref:PhzF family phenazine biosynthesis protein n=1 Tax=Paenibacillus hexagrammi TaxID=2908839 RepID=UPI00288351F5|nr:PhzF family phenazine biosynthesis protein [Paenibacillus sp. YPD9-1]
MNTPIYVIDAFTNEPFRGNPAAVCILSEPVNEEWMQQVAAEMNLSETAFIQQVSDGYSLRWFTPATEVDLCGHATLATAHALWEQGYLGEGEQARFHTRSGLLTALKRGDWIEMSFPLDEPAPFLDDDNELLQALGIQTPLYIGKGVADIIVEVETEEQVRTLAPNFAALERIRLEGCW